jgi:hypothetical protein
MGKLYPVSIVISLLSIAQFAAAQSFKDIHISKRYKNVPLRDVIGELKENHGLNFFFVDQQIDSVKITAEVNNQLLEQALKIILHNTRLNFFFDKTRIVLYQEEKKVVKPSSVRNLFTIHGTITDAKTKEAIPSANVYIQTTHTGFSSDANGTYTLKDLPQGIYLIQYSFIGYATQEQKVLLDRNLEVNISLPENITELETVNVSPALYEISVEEAMAHTMSNKEIFHSPNLAKDVSRTLRVLPGIASNDFSAKPRIRGGSTDESVFYLDNFEIISPFHFEEFDGFFSIINTDYISNVKVIPGGFSPAYTDKLAGVIDIKTPGIVDGNKTSASIDLINTTLFFKRKINDKLDVQFSGRRTYLDLLLNFNKSEEIQLDPIYFDIWAKVNYRVNEKNTLALSFLHATDAGKARVRESSFNWIDMNGKRKDNYFWLNWKHTPNARYQHITTLGFQHLGKTTDFSFNNTISRDNEDDRLHDVLMFSHTSFQRLGERNKLEFGGDIKHFDSQLRFYEIRFNNFESTRDETVIDSIDVNSKFSTTLGGLFLQNTFHLSKNVNVTAGVRASYFNSTKESLHLAPRFGASIRLNEHLNVKIGYGIYNQAAYPNETRIYDGEQFPTQDPKQSIHYTASINYSKQNTNFSINAYYKDNKRLYDDYRYDVFNRLGGGIAILDKSFVTASGFSQGVEAIFRHTYSRKSTITASYAYAINKIRNETGLEAYRDNDRRHTLILNNLLNLKNNWAFSAYSIFYTGEPYTPSSTNFVGESDERQILFFNLGEKNSARLPAFYSLDLRIDKFWYFRKWQLNAYLNIMNLTGHKNVRNYFWAPYPNAQGDYNVSKIEEIYLSTIFISPGVSFSF